MRKIFILAVCLYFLRVDQAPAADVRALALPRNGAANSFSLAPYVARAVEGEAYAVGIGRITADGKADVVLATEYHPITQIRDTLYLFEQGPGGTLNPPVDQGIIPAPDIFESRDLVILDIDGLNGMDVVVAGSGGLVPFVSTDDGQLTRRPRFSTVATTDLVLADLYAAGTKDIISGYWSLAGEIHRNNRDGSFTSTPWSPRIFGYNHFASGDLDGDGDDDIAVSSGQGATPRTTLYRNLRNGGLQQITTLNDDCCVFGSNGVGIGEFTGDGLKDVVVSVGGNVPSAFVLLFARPSLAQPFARTPIASLDSPRTLRVADIDVDGRDDIIVLHGTYVGVYLQKTPGVLSPEDAYPIPSVSFQNGALAIGDISDDGCPDVVAASYVAGLVTLLGTNCNVLFRHGFE